MKRNRRRKVRMGFAPNMLIISTITAVLVAVFYVSFDSKCKSLRQDKSRLESQLSELDRERQREAAKWDDKKTPERLKETLVQHGLDMDYPAADQVLRVDQSGRPLPNQPALARMMRLQSSDPLVKVSGR